MVYYSQTGASTGGHFITCGVTSTGNTILALVLADTTAGQQRRHGSERRAGRAGTGLAAVLVAEYPVPEGGRRARSVT